ncbi:PREDICTED: uncharacterized protein LOC106792696 [Polistes canadensis]|uniref:uncharacterized protein LOC106792696 n=1 Tax=Polistes canadensis TaxID=91411 RepID=UPI000718C6DA|nr:PREDICTED: uncharacterized protein LOC106792696 [Polistes canadensis]
MCDLGNALVSSKPARHSKRINNSRRNALLGPERNFRSRHLMRNERRFNSLRNWPRSFHQGQFQAYSTSATISCSICRERNKSSECEQLLRAEPEKRRRIVVNANLCCNCLQAGHRVYTCIKNDCCRKCKNRHQELLHVNEAVTECATTGITSFVVRKASAVQNAHVELHHLQTPSLLLTAVVHLLDRDSRPHECRELLDSGFEAHFLTIRFANLLRIAKREANVPISGENQTETRVKQAILATLKSRTENYLVEIQLLLLLTVTNRLPSQRIPREELTIPVGIQLADPKFCEPANIDAIVRVEIFASLCRAGQSIRLNENLMAQGTVRGLLVISTGATRTPQSVNCHTATVDLDSQWEKFWKIEEVAESSIRSHEENLCEPHYKNNTRRDDTGRYIVRLPFKKENQLGDSYTSALRRIHALERSLSRKPEIRNEYIKFLSEYKERWEKIARYD